MEQGLPEGVGLLAGALRAGVIGEDEDALVCLGRAAVQQLLRCPQAILQMVGALLWCAAHSLLKFLLCTEPKRSFLIRQHAWHLGLHDK
jgi:hypothetical protein